MVMMEDAHLAAKSVLAMSEQHCTTKKDRDSQHELLSRAAPALSVLRAVNRDAYRAMAESRAEVRHARSEVDDAALQLQHATYERKQLEAQIAACHALETVYETVDVRPLEEFQSQAPESMRTEEVLADEHQTLIHRLQFELEERRRLEQHAKNLETELTAGQREKRASIRALRARQKQIASLIESASR
ncbi:hypothetical protein MYAM1_001600 [Malassezia yamatoensis]|uniref:Uncharacterized protein n=1 Tax=Malassezia yamatoensis TaxID=253288 RepID=A0AAJ5YSD5_9BASI|nr:hypothetical protein MYAM1_001600 [Malassezia yamatoensis]